MAGALLENTHAPNQNFLRRERGDEGALAPLTTGLGGILH